MTKRKLKHFENLLLKERERELRDLGYLEDRLNDMPKDSANDLSSHPYHIADQGTDAEEREIESILATTSGEALYKIDQALRKIYSGKYGICESCSDKIEEGRLEAVPYASLCIRCEEEEEERRRA